MMVAAPETETNNQSKVLIVTGASRGIGAATALHAAQRGYAICVNYLARQKEAEQVVRTIEREKGRAIAVQADVSSEPDVVVTEESS